jgi:hypothetical protein
VHRLTKAEARRIAVWDQLLHAPPPKDLLAVVRQLTLLQIDLTAAVAPSADLVAWISPRGWGSITSSAASHALRGYRGNQPERPARVGRDTEGEQ